MERTMSEIQETDAPSLLEWRSSLLEVWEKEKLKMMSELSAEDLRLYEKMTQKLRKHPS